jgi:hypothetical protein
MYKQIPLERGVASTTDQQPRYIYISEKCIYFNAANEGAVGTAVLDGPGPLEPIDAFRAAANLVCRALISM